MPRTKNAARRTKTGSGTFLPDPWTKTKRMYSLTYLNILLHLNICRPTILYRVFESVYARQRELRELTKDNIRSRIAITVKSASLTDCNLTKDELHALQRLKTRQGHSHTSRGQRTCYCCYGQEGLAITDEMDSLVYDKRTYEPLKRDPTPALQRRLNGKLLVTIKRQRLLKFNYITGSDAAYHNQLNLTDYLNFPSLTYRCDP